MANTTEGRSHNAPSHEAQVKGGEHSHGAKESDKKDASPKGGGKSARNQPSHQASVKGGQHSDSGSGNK